MQNHNHRHDQRKNMRHARGSFKDDGVREINGAGVTCRLDHVCARNGRRRTDEEA